MAYQQSEPVTQAIILVGLLVVGFLACKLAIDYYNDTRFEQTLDAMRDRNHLLFENINNGYKQLEYYQSEQYKDKYAKENLGLLNSGEKALVLTEDVSEGILRTVDQDAIRAQNEAAFYERVRQIPVIQHWQLYFFNRKRIEAIRQAG